METKNSLVVGSNTYTDLISGNKVRVVKLNNAATTSPFLGTLNVLKPLFNSYGALHRGAGPHANKTVEMIERSLGTIREFLGVSNQQTMLFSSNTSVAINLLARLLVLTEEDVILTSCIEHTSNNLPWRYNTKARIIEIDSFDDGSLDLDDLERKAIQHKEHLKWVAITGASNLTGYVSDLKKISSVAHACGARLFVDAAQLVPHRPIHLQKQGIDAMAFSSHKVYSPFGLGVLILPKDLLHRFPVDPGGGSVDMISDESVCWASSLERHQAGTWNVTGIVALAESFRIMTTIGWNEILKHEHELVQYMVERMAEIHGLTLLVSGDKFLSENRIGTFPFMLDGYHHALLSAILDHEFAIETRAGTICNHRLVRRWFHVNDKAQREIEEAIKGGNRLASYGVVRASIGIYNTKEDIDRLIDALIAIQKNGPQLSYKALPDEETYIPKN